MNRWRDAWPDILGAIKAAVTFWSCVAIVCTVILTAPSWSSYVDGKVNEWECKQERRVYVYENVGHQGSME